MNELVPIGRAFLVPIGRAFLVSIALIGSGALVLSAHGEAGTLEAPVVEDVQITCNTSGVLIAPASGKVHEGCECQNNSSTVVYAGDSGVSTASPKYCNDTASCLRGWWIAPRGQYCEVASGTQTIECNCAVR